MVQMEAGRKSRRTRDERAALILDTAARLFYARGVHEVGMDSLIAETGLGKATVYRLYGSKADLIGAYLGRLSREILEAIDGDLATGDPTDAINGVLDAIEADIGREGFRGCPFNNASIEFADPDHPARRAARDYRQALANRLQAAATQLTGHDADGRRLGRELAVLVDGAYTSAAHLGPEGPASDGLRLARRLVRDPELRTLPGRRGTA